ncbi:hypothetical protein NDU88_001020 [Pleurodeles waltl]|uniref:Uncharacterized protein n=1 Tax=Pleurodeles waltl TaxID=8319 RepID=A0AAV7NDK3_PLEWA|nr:hypothetical protein NDU88_001020 [Pleurodeles waltl]
MPVPSRSAVELKEGPVFKAAGKMEGVMHAGPVVSGVKKTFMALPEARQDMVCLSARYRSPRMPGNPFRHALGLAQLPGDYNSRRPRELFDAP